MLDLRDFSKGRLQHMEKRVNKLRKYMCENNIDAAFVSFSHNVYYFSGFTGGEDARLIITADKAYIITDSRYTIQVAAECKGFISEISSALNRDSIKNILENENIRTLAIENESIMLCEYRLIKSIADDTSITLVDLDFFIENNLRNYKDAGELDTIRKACNIAEESFMELLDVIRPGLSEREVASELEYKMRRKGAEGVSFDTIVASGIRSSMPHATASDKIIEKGDIVTIDFGAVYNKYCSDHTRTFFVGKPDSSGKSEFDELCKIYNIVLTAQNRAITGFEYGVTGKDLDCFARDYITFYGYGEYFGHGLGHGVGLEVHENIRINKRGDTVLENGYVFSIEPGIYVNNLGGVRIEDLFTIENNKLVNLSPNIPKKLLVL